ncbi:MAG TPA: twin-arginine translocase TatA/TatE family subunit [Anaerolineaceae bacterium]|nr:twin-arginine translocase TatA/TatE family subunit [Anaerolineaceae bacterium]HQP08802.1 twin-arginine translocase TatA/TatE family subunit [Anaerolineaceae bacterium]
MPFRLGTTELIIILVIIILLFGVGRISKIAGELGGGIKAFRKSVKEDDKPNEEVSSEDGNKSE